MATEVVAAKPDRRRIWRLALNIFKPRTTRTTRTLSLERREARHSSTRSFSFVWFVWFVVKILIAFGGPAYAFAR